MSKTPRFSKATIDFMIKAGRQKNPDWLDRNRDDYESLLLEPLKHLAATLKTRLAVPARGYHFPQKGIGRMKRSSIRAQEYGSLYKDWLGYSASRPSDSRFDRNPSLFFMINTDDKEGDQVLLAGGLYMPSSRQLRSIREAIARDASAFDELFATPAFKARFPGGFSDERKSSRPPRGFDPSHPRIELLKHQGYFTWRSYKMREFSAPDFAETVAKDCIQLLKLNDLLELAIAGRLPFKTLKDATGLKKSKSGSSKLESLLDDIKAPRREMDF